jgi:hypothetical protein
VAIVSIVSRSFCIMVGSLSRRKAEGESAIRTEETATAKEPVTLFRVEHPPSFFLAHRMLCIISMILANCRAKMTAGDFDFIVRVMGATGGQKVSLAELLCDEACRDCLLDQEPIYRAILESPDRLDISPHLLFYVLCRHLLRETPASARETSDYLASMLGKFLHTARLNAPEEMADQDMRYISDALRCIAQANSGQAFILRSHLANYTLFLSGVFHEHLEKRGRRGGPSLKFYEEVGRTNFAVAAKDREARRLGLQSIFHDLAESFHEVRLALTDLADRLLHLHDSPVPFLAGSCGSNGCHSTT